MRINSFLQTATLPFFTLMGLSACSGTGTDSGTGGTGGSATGATTGSGGATTGGPPPPPPPPTPRGELQRSLGRNNQLRRRGHWRNRRNCQYRRNQYRRCGYRRSHRRQQHRRWGHRRWGHRRRQYRRLGWAGHSTNLRDRDVYFRLRPAIVQCRGLPRRC